MLIGAVFRDKSEKIRESSVSLTALSLTNVSLRFAICNCTIIQLRQNFSQNFNVNFHKKIYQVNIKSSINKVPSGTNCFYGVNNFGSF